MGAFHAFHAIARGLRVAVLEKSSEPRGATTQNFGQVVPSGLDSSWQKFGRESLRIYQEIQEQVDISVRQLGSIYIASNDEEVALIEELHSINQDNEYASELWTQSQCLARYPQLRSEYCRAGLFFPDELSVNPRQMIHQLWKFLAENPLLDFFPRTTASRIETTGGAKLVSVTAADGRTFCAAKAIVCSGSDFQLLFPDVFRESDLELVKLQMTRLEPLPAVSIPGNVLTGLSIRRYESFAQCPSWSEIKSREPEDSFEKKWGVHILFKQESDGRIILGDSHEYLPVSSSDSFSNHLRADISDFFIQEGSKIFDLPGTKIETSWSGIYCQTKHPSGVLRQTIDDHIHIVTGVGGKGMTSSAGFAKYNLSQILD